MFKALVISHLKTTECDTRFLYGQGFSLWQKRFDLGNAGSAQRAEDNAFERYVVIETAEIKSFFVRRKSWQIVMYSGLVLILPTVSFCG